MSEWGLHNEHGHYNPTHIAIFQWLSVAKYLPQALATQLLCPIQTPLGVSCSILVRGTVCTRTSDTVLQYACEGL